MTQFVTGKAREIAKEMGSKSIEAKMKQFGDHYDTRVYQTTHNVGGAIMGEDPQSSVVNRFLQSWDAHNVFVHGFERLSAEYRLQSAGFGRSVDILVRKGHSYDLSKTPGPLMQA